jgi:hypothetical protein
MTAKYISVIMDLVDKIISEDRKRKYSNALILKILLITQIYRISYRSTEKFFNNHPDLKEAICLNEIPNFRTLSGRARMIDWHYVNAMILDLISTEKENAAIDSFIVKTCKNSTAIRRKRYRNYRDQHSSWGFSTKGWECVMKEHIPRYRFHCNSGMGNNNSIP